ncbi:hypothetical protein N665_1909s0005 [Sinapis alba]|nr:hypothetical protein N665_1909s0005 [Sinapis alba]
MKGGDGEHSYANNKLTSISFSESIKVAELGCSSGQNTFLSGIVNTIIASYQEISGNPPKIDCCLNDLPNNDFNMNFKWASSFNENLKMDVKGRCFVSGVLGSFYSRLFASKSLHFVHSACSIHWLSKVSGGIEDNKKNVYIRKPCPLSVSKSYLDQFQKDFSLFLKIRSKEVVSNRRMVLIFRGRNAFDPLYRESYHYYGGIVKESDVDSFNLQFYDAGEEEVREVVQIEGSFEINNIEIHEHLVPYKDSEEDDNETCRLEFGEMMASRKGSIEILVAHFGYSIINRLFEKYAQNAVKYHIVSRSCNKMTVNFVVSLNRK